VARRAAAASDLRSELHRRRNRTNLVVVKLGNSSKIDIYNALGQTDLIMDLVGYYGSAVPAPARPIKPFSLHLAPIQR